MSETRKPFPQFNSFRPFVVDELRRRKSTEIPTPVVAPLIRLTSCMVDDSVDYAFFSIGLHGYDKPDGANIFDLTYGSNKEVVGYSYSRNKDPKTGKHNKRLIYADDVRPNISAYTDEKSGVTADQSEIIARQKQSNFLKKVVPAAAHPIPGITNASVLRRGLGQPLIATVNWQCYNQGQLEFLRNHFLLTGNYVILEFGNQFSDKQITKTIDFQSDHEQTFDLLQKTVGAVTNTDTVNLNGRKYVIDNYNTPNDGNYDYIVGQISNFEIKIDPDTGIYKCMTKIVSQGENVWGIKLDMTSVDVTSKTVSTGGNKITSIRDYFLYSYYSFIQTNITNKTKGVYQKLGDAWSNGKYSSAENTKDTDKVDQNANDYAFLTWNFTFNELFQDMINVIEDDDIKREIHQYIKFGTVLPEDFVGYHKDLRSVEPETMLLISSDISGQIDSGLGDARFGPASGSVQTAGKLDSGVWINTGAIRESFLSSNDLRQSISLLLSRMNRSVGGYWQLQLFWDDERSEYRVIDYKYGTQYRDIKFYKFNVGGAGECLELDFNSAFPPELVTQMNLVSMLQTMTIEEQNKYKTQYPLLGTTSAHMFMLNWTHLKDGLRDRITTWRKNASTSPSNTATANVDRTGTTTLSRVAQTEGIGNLPSVLGTTTRDVGDTAGESPVRTNPLDNRTITPSRSSVSTTSKFTDEQLLLLNSRIDPVTSPMSISSPFGERKPNPAVPDASTNHHGIDIRAAEGTLVSAAMPGVVQHAGEGASGINGGYGLFVTIQHGRGIITTYGHLSRVNVPVGKYVLPGEIIGFSGNTGTSDGPHLHYGITVNGIAVDPLDISKSSTAAIGPVIPAPKVPASEQPKTTSVQTAATDQATNTKSDAIKKRRKEVTDKFGDVIVNLIAEHPGDMINKITKDGYSNATLPNQFVAPFPTTTNITVEIQGLAGISVSDGFFVDKIPFLFERHGVFQVTETTDTISHKGWRTSVSGYFKMLWYDGRPGDDPAIY